MNESIPYIEYVFLGMLEISDVLYHSNFVGEKPGFALVRESVAYENHRDVEFVG